MNFYIILQYEFYKYEFYKNAALKVFAQLGQLIEEDENKPIPFNLLDLNKDILNIIGDFVKKDNNKEKEKTQKIQNK